MIKKFKILVILLLLLPFNVKASQELPVDVLNMDIQEIQEAHSLGLFTYESLVRFYLDRIDKYNKQYNCVITINDKAIEQAKELDKKYKESGLISNLMGIPIIVKDNIDVYGMPTTAGTKALKDNYPDKNAIVIQNLIDKGAIIIAKSNMSELAFSASDSKSSYGNTYNAYNTLYSPYGSSGGSAVAVASGLAVAALGTDTNASIRTPSSANNVIGLRPTYGLVDSQGVIKYDSTRDTIGPITRYVKDNILLLNIMTGNNININTNLDTKSIKIGVISSWMKENSSSSITSLSSTYKEIVSLMNKSIDILKKQGFEIVEINDFYNSDYEYLVTSTYSGTKTLCYEFNKYISNSKSKIKSFSGLISNGGYIQYLNNYDNYCYTDYLSTELYKTNTQKREKLKEYVDSVMDKYNVDVLLYPTTKNKLLKITESGVIDLKTNSYVISPTIGYPSINVPIGFDSEDLPYGMEILTKKNGENLLYSIAYSYEKSTNYYKLPSISPNLYELPNKIDTLINYYEKYNTSKYKDINQLVKSFFENYNEIENKQEVIEKYILEYEELSKEEIKNTNSKKVLIIIFSIILVILIFILLIMFIMLNINNKKKFNKHKYFKKINKSKK